MVDPGSSHRWSQDSAHSQDLKIRRQSRFRSRVSRIAGQRPMNELNHLQRAALLLFDGPEGYLPPLNDVAEAFGCIWAALAFAERWPAVMRAEAAGLIVAMRRHGQLQHTARVMSDSELREFLIAFRRFCADAEALLTADDRQQANGRSMLKCNPWPAGLTHKGRPMLDAPLPGEPFAASPAPSSASEADSRIPRT